MLIFLDHKIKIITKIKKEIECLYLNRSSLEHGVVEAPVGQLCHTIGRADVSLELGDLGEDWKLARLLESSEAVGQRSGLGGDDHNWGVSPIGSCDSSHEVTVLKAQLVLS